MHYQLVAGASRGAMSHGTGGATAPGRETAIDGRWSA